MNTPDPPSTLHFFVDEAGDPTLFDSKGRIMVGQEGCSKTFILGKLDAADPAGLHAGLERLRGELLADPYFKRVPSMQAERGKTALAFHAKDDVAEVRREVFKVLMALELRFYAVVRNKASLLDYVRQRNEREPGYRYRGDELYDTLLRFTEAMTTIWPIERSPMIELIGECADGPDGRGGTQAGTCRAPDAGREDTCRSGQSCGRCAANRVHVEGAAG